MVPTHEPDTGNAGVGSEWNRHRLPKSADDFFIQRSGAIWNTPVSYTHLDVYKRQGVKGDGDEHENDG